MSAPGAKRGDEVVGMDTHIVMVPSPAGPVPTPTPSMFQGELLAGLSTTVCIDNEDLAVRGSKAFNKPAHVPAGGPFQTPPSNQATVDSGSSTIFVDNKKVARAGDQALTCNDPQDAPNGVVIASGSVFFGG